MSGAHPEATKGAGGAVACVRAVGPSEGRTTVRGASPHTCSAVLGAVSYTTRGMSLPSSRETVSTCEGTGGASVNTQTVGARRLLRCTSTPFGSALGASAAIGHGARLADAARCTTVCRVGQLGKSRVLKTKAGK